MIKANLGMFLLICGSKSSQRRAAYVSSMAFKSKHRHIVSLLSFASTLSKTDHCLFGFPFQRQKISQTKAS